jgi:hypothetical protein
MQSPLGLPVLRLFSCADMPSPLPRQDRGTCSLILSILTSAFPEIVGRSAPALIFRGLLSVHSRYGLQTRGVALRDPFHRRLRRLRYLHRRSDCYRVERTSSRAGLSPAVDQRLSRRTPTGWPEAVTRPRLPQNPACGFPALGSSEVDSQFGDSLQLRVGEVIQLWSQAAETAT